MLVVHNGFDELARKTLTSVDPDCQRMVLAWISNYDIQHLPAAPQPCRVCMRAAAGCPEGGRHRSRPVGPEAVYASGSEA